MLYAPGTAFRGAVQFPPEQHLLGRVLVQPRPRLSLAWLDNIVKLHDGHRRKVIKQLNDQII